MDKPKYLITNPVHNGFNKIQLQNDIQLFTDIYGEIKATRIKVPKKIYKITNNNISDPYSYNVDLKYK